MSDGRFYLTMECENCGESSLSLCMTTDSHNGLPVIPVDIAAQNSFACDCGAVTYTGDLDVQVDTDGCHGDEDDDTEEVS